VLRVRDAAARQALDFSWRDASGKWFRLSGLPKGTPKDVIAKLNSAMNAALADPATRKRLADIGQEIYLPEQLTPEALGGFQKAEIEKWWPIIKAAGIRAQ
jgi:tripartite-type tricarboxylate transporter receptor subunit TctC